MLPKLIANLSNANNENDTFIISLRSASVKDKGNSSFFKIYSTS